MRPELLAPAGDWECVRAAVENGADAIYFGLDRFNARMRAKNFTEADLPSLMEFLHRRGVRGYVTFNTLVFANELAEAEDYVRTIIAAGVDAAIVQDVGICRLIRRFSPDFPIHCSTQMTITSAAGVDFARELGAQLVVLARENSLADIAKIRAVDAASARGPMPLEVFVHGALCVAYSGQCLTSESLGGRSANRGECAQACRLPYDLIADGQQVPLGDRRYLLSPQDLAGIEVLPELVRAGVASLKIEGRLKSAEYVASITRVYRAALDRIFSAAAAPSGASSNSAAVDPSARYELEMTFSRGLQTGWFRGTNNQELVHARFGTKRGVYLGEVARVAHESVAVQLTAPLKPGDGVVFDAGQPDQREEGGRVYQVEAEPHSRLTTLRFGRGDIDWRRVAPGQRVWKTNDPALDRELRATYAGDKIRHQRPITMEVHGHAGSPLTIVARDGEGHVVQLASALPLAAAATQPLTRERLHEQLARLGGTPFKLGELQSHLEGNVILPVSELNRLRRELVTALEHLRAQPKRWTWSAAATAEPRSSVSAISAQVATEPPAGAAELIAVIRLPEQLEPAWSAGARTIYAEFENPKHYRDAVARFRTLQLENPQSKIENSSIWVAAPRIFKPGEEWILAQVRSCNADGYLIRNYDHLAFFAADRKRGDFSLNVANPLSAEYFLHRYGLERVTASYDLNFTQLEALLLRAPPAWFDLTIHQHMPMFHMEHCVFCAFLSDGKDYRDCGRPCDRHRVTLRDRVGAELPLKADAGCRNTVFNNRAQTGAEYVARLLELGARQFRVEFVNESPDEVARTVDRYARLLRGEISGADLWRELKLLNQLGVTRGQMESAAPTLRRKT
ncbi:U32 family peptidase [Opitutus terrae]|uniref:Peptidase U32 n=1 Tax=Opitutus terrae (strain DSM 11246 / JCM 15787 / PB90-1) TaxID=452637 RepID=B1ZUP9_OPITP|nr:U32 family peptidase [Opitutus terrae]ACB74933.1 peptidase U32 [Opitutus terrae PB90-1]